MGDLAALTLAIDSTPVISGEESLKRLAVAATEAELQAVRMGSNMDSAFKKMSASAIASSNASANAYMGLSTSVKEVEKSTSSATSMMDKMGNRVENMALRSAVHFALITVAIMGTMKALEAMIELKDKENDAQMKLDIGGATAADTASGFGNSIGKDVAAGATGVGGMDGSLERQAVLRAQIMAQGPEYRNIIGLETMNYQDLLKTLREVNAEKLKTIEADIEEAKAIQQNKAPGMGSALWDNLIRGGTFERSQAAVAKKWNDAQDAKLTPLNAARAALMHGQATLNGAYDKTGTGTEDTTTQYGREIQRLQEQLAGFTQGEEAAYRMKLQLMDNGAGGNVNKALDLRGSVLSAQDDRASADFSHSLAMKQSDDYRNLKEALDPLYKESLEYANAVYLISQYTEDAELKTRLLGSAYRTMTQDGKIDSASADFAHSLMMSQSDDYRSLKYSLDPAYKAALDYANAVRLIEANTEDAGERTKLLAAALATMTPDGIAAAEALKKLNDEASHLNQKDDFTTRLAHLNDVNGTGILKPDAYADELLKIMKMGDSPLGPVTQAMDHFGDSAANAMGRWATGMDGAAIHWSSMIRSMMADWASMEAKKGMSSLFGYLEGGMAGLFGFGGGDPGVPGNTADFSSGNGAELGNMGGSTYTPYPTQAVVAASGNAAQVGVTVNVAPNGQSTAQVTGQGATAMGEQLRAAVTAIIVQHQRPGGVLNPVNP